MMTFVLKEVSRRRDLECCCMCKDLLATQVGSIYVRITKLFARRECIRLQLRERGRGTGGSHFVARKCKCSALMRADGCTCARYTLRHTCNEHLRWVKS